MDGPNVIFLNLRISDQIELILIIKFEIFKKSLSLSEKFKILNIIHKVSQ